MRAPDVLTLPRATRGDRERPRTGCLASCRGGDPFPAMSGSARRAAPRREPHAQGRRAPGPGAGGEGRAGGGPRPDRAGDWTKGGGPPGSRAVRQRRRSGVGRQWRRGPSPPAQLGHTQSRGGAEGESEGGDGRARRAGAPAVRGDGRAGGEAAGGARARGTAGRAGTSGALQSPRSEGLAGGPFDSVPPGGGGVARLCRAARSRSASGCTSGPTPVQGGENDKGVRAVVGGWIFFQF